MGRSEKFFHFVGRINAVLILIAAGAITFGVGLLLIQEFGSRAARNREAEAGIPVAGSNVKTNLQLSRVSMVQGTDIMRADLQRYPGEAKFSSGYNSETRNILFIVPGEKTARWLLPDNDHLIAKTSDIAEKKDRDAERVIATAVLVKSAAEPSESATGKLLLFDPSGKKVVEVSNNVREIHLASISGNELNILYERNRHLVQATFDSQTISKLREIEVDVPQLK
ncbi:MAG: hypothetical protein JWN45_3525 [Acidobacteriaceae bacterium]|nr:hypothetical protein [Acidobacteriaceae bacterium]